MDKAHVLYLGGKKTFPKSEGRKIQLVQVFHRRVGGSIHGSWKLIFLTSKGGEERKTKSTYEWNELSVSIWW